MANAKTAAEATVTRTMRVAIKVADNYYTLEETISLPPGASDTQIAEAVGTGWRIYEQQRQEMEKQLVELQAQAAQMVMGNGGYPGGNGERPAIREPNAPASERQRGFIDRLLHDLGWDETRLSQVCAELGYNPLTLTKHEAAQLIDRLKATLADQQGTTQEQSPPPAPEPPQAAAATFRMPNGNQATQRQIRALTRTAEERGLNLFKELEASYPGRNIDQLTMDEAGALLAEWQQRPRV